MTSYATLLGSTPRPGLQGTQQGEVRATVYRGTGQLTLSAIPLDGNRQTDPNPSIVQAQVQMSMGAAASFQLTLKVPDHVDMLALVQDDDWVDIEFGINGTFWHVLRGLIDQLRISVNVGPSGTVSRSCLLVGQSFQKVWQQTPMWFSSIYADAQSLQDGKGLTSGLALLGIGQNVPDTISSFLFTYANRVAKAGRSSLRLPANLPNNSGEFGTSWRLDATDFSDYDAPRRSLLANGYQPNQNVWDVAQSWSDPLFVEMFTAQLPAVGTRRVAREGALGVGQSVNVASAMGTLRGEKAYLPNGLSIAQSAMTLVLRNKPFITVSGESAHERGYASPWFSLPMFEAQPQQVTAIDLGKNGMERCNAFFCSSQIVTASGSSLSDTALPLWSVPDMQDHGMRPMDSVSQYTPAFDPMQSPTVIYKRLRARIRDWYMANHLLLSGNVTFGRGYPQLQPGVRLRLLAPQDKDQITGYIESVVHSYAPGQGVQTSVGITRAYQGSDASHLSALRDLVGDYTAPIA